MKDNFLHLHGTMSTFGGPDDMGVSPSEGLALCEQSEMDEFESIFLDEQPPNTTGLARRLDPYSFYLAARWNYDHTSKDWLQDHQCVVSNPETGQLALAQPIDWGPHEDTGRVADLSPGLAEFLKLKTDDECEVLVPLPRTRPSKPAKPSVPTGVAEGGGYKSIAISSGHGAKVAGASGPSPWGLVEHPEAVRLVNQLAKDLRAKGVEVKTFEDTTSTSQDQNLKTIVNWHNAQKREVDISVHFNAFEITTTKPMGVEVCFLTQEELAKTICDAIAGVTGLPNRGPKYRDGLAFLNGTNEPAVLIETLFCDAKPDCDTYRAKFNEICAAVAKALTSAQVDV